MIILDTHIWVWWTHADERSLGPLAGLTDGQTRIIKANEGSTIGVSAISCWEIAKLVQSGRLDLGCDLGEWFADAISYQGIRVIELTPEVAIESTKLPAPFQTDPADQIIVATARIWRCPLVTSDRKLTEYPHVETVA